MRRLTVAEYRELLAGVSIPSREQLEAFALFVSTAHSWYKHLPTLPPGVPMTFFLDPGAGAQLTIDAGGHVRQTERLKHGFHYSWLPTAQYRERFGHAAFAATAGTSVSLLGADGTRQIPADDAPLVFDPRTAELVAPPDEVMQAGVAYLSAVVHPRAAYHRVWRIPPDFDISHVDWPAESGGPTAFAQIIERCRALSAGAPELRPEPGDELSRYGGDLELHRLLTPERERQQRRIVAALDRVIRLTYP